MHRKEHIQEIEEFVQITNSQLITFNYEVIAKIWKGALLQNTLTANLCQITKNVHNPEYEEDEFVPDHSHTFSFEVFYQLTGHTYFGDGSKIGPTEIKIIPPGTANSCKISEDGACIVIVHPPIKDLPKGSD